MNLWMFSLALYARPGVERACLQAQDAGADVCLLLCGAWLEQRGVAYRTAAAQELRARALHRQTTLIEPLRNLRRHLGPRATHSLKLAQLRAQIKELELAAERQLLEQLERLAQPWPSSEPFAGGLWLESLAAPLAAGHPILKILREQNTALTHSSSATPD